MKKRKFNSNSLKVSYTLCTLQFNNLNFDLPKKSQSYTQNSCEGIKSGLVPAQPLSDLASPIDDNGCSVNTSECCNATG